MASDSSPYFNNDFEYVYRKKRNRKKSKFKPVGKETPEELERNVTEFTENQTNDNDSEAGSDDVLNSEVPTPIETPNMEPRFVSLDGMASVPPQLDREAILAAEEYLNSKDMKLHSLEPERESKSSPQPISGDENEESPLINTKALSKTATTYELERFEKNVLIIFNQKEVEGHSTRLGTEKDVEALTRTFSKFDFEVVEHLDFTKKQIEDELKAFSRRNFTEYGCVAVAVLTHGSDNGLLRAKDQLYSEVEIIKHFKVINKPTLVTKPKIIIIQACRGSVIVPGAPVMMRAGKVRRDLDEPIEPYILPVESDMLILHSSYYGSPSHRNDLHGSWFIQELCNKIDSRAATEDLESIVTEVKREVAINKEHEEYNRRTLEIDINKQMPVITSTLIRKLYFRKFGENPMKLQTFMDGKRDSVASEVGQDSYDTVSNTPFLVQLGPCSCFLDYFNYLRNCLRHFCSENPHDEAALHLLDVADTFEEGDQFNTSKQKMITAISKHLVKKAQGCPYFKYLFINKQG